MGLRYVWDKHGCNIIYNETVTTYNRYGTGGSSHGIFSVKYTNSVSGIGGGQEYYILNNFQIKTISHLGSIAIPANTYFTINYSSGEAFPPEWEEETKYTSLFYAKYNTGISFSDNGYGYLNITFSRSCSGYRIDEEYNKDNDNYYGQISSGNSNSYPTNNHSGSYWYTYKGSDSIDPTRVTIPSSIKGGNRISISVTKSSTNTYGGTITYQYQICLNGSSIWTTLRSTTASSYSYTVPVGTTSIQARVKASDNTGFTSTDYVTSLKRTVTNNTAPSTPSSISVPSSIQAGKAFTVSWGASTDSDGNLSGYTLQRSLNGGSYSTIYTGSSRSYQDTIPKSGYTSVTYRVQAYDTDGATSSYRTSNTATVINNVAPVISGSDSNLGTFTYNPPTISYVVTDENNDIITVIIKLDSSTLETKTITLGQTYTVPISWWDINTGSHTVTIIANDGQGGTATRTYTFTKNSVGLISFNRLHKKTDNGYQITYIETDSDSIITNNGQVLSERLSDIASKLSNTINKTPTEMVLRHRVNVKITSEYTIDYLEMYTTNIKVGSNTLEEILTQLERKVGISNSGTVPSDLNFERWRMKNSSGEYDIIYLESISEHIIRPCGKTVEESLQAIESKL